MGYALLQTGNIVSFSVQSNIIGGNFEGVEVLGVVSHEIARLQADVQALHFQFKSYIPALPNAYTDYAYLIAKLPNGSKTVLGLPWLIESSITLSQQAAYTIVISGVEPGDVDSIRRGLVNRGLNVESFEKNE
jgi:hypothetical protein